ncbi:MAG: hypothetical protein ACR2IV_17475 [Bryobacteraceae bacterium]
MQDWRSDIEKWIVLLAVFAFLCLGIVFIASVLITKDLADTYRRMGIGVGCVLFAAFWFAISPGNQGRTIQRFLGLLQTPVRAEDIALLQQTVGGAGFFNRIGLTGIPLAVALLACVLYGLVFAARRMEYKPEAEAFLEMAKLTTGAFIGALSTSARKVSPQRDKSTARTS